MQIKSFTRPRQKTVLIATLMMGSFLVLLNQMLLVTAVPPIMAAFDIPFSTAQWLTTGFFLVNGIMIPVSAFLINKFTSRSLYLTGMMIFIAGTIFAAFAPVYSVLLAGRILQGIAAGIMMPLTQVILLTQFPLEQRGQGDGVLRARHRAGTGNWSAACRDTLSASGHGGRCSSSCCRSCSPICCSRTCR